MRSARLKPKRKRLTFQWFELVRMAAENRRYGYGI
jgi:hypothetical protein